MQVSQSQPSTKSHPQDSIAFVPTNDTNLLTAAYDSLNQIKPIADASERILRLLKTVAIIIYLYQVDHYKSKLLTTFGIDVKNDQTELRHLEANVSDKKELLHNAQIQYAKKTSISSDEKEQSRKAVLKAAQDLSNAEMDLMSYEHSDESVHHRAAVLLRDLCRANKGCYIKIGQHIANLDHLVPNEFIQVLSSLFADAPQMCYNDVREVIKEDLGKYPEEIFDVFQTTPIASASLAQVHVAECNGKKLAVKVQHRGLRETSEGDLWALKTVVKTVDAIFEDFKYNWIVDEIAPNLPLELDFQNEGRNSDYARSFLDKSKINCIVPKIHWDKSTTRVLVMDFEDGFSTTNTDKMNEMGINKQKLSRLVMSVFQSQIFQSGFVHCDPHPENVLWRKRDGKIQVVLLDHGLYKQLSDDFRLEYANLWKSLMVADVKGIEMSCAALGVHDMYPLLAAMLTSKPFDEIQKRSKSGKFASRSELDANAEKVMIRGYAQQYLNDIILMLDKVPRQMLLLFKMNDCLRHIDIALGSKANTLVISGKYASELVYKHSISKAGIFKRFREWISYTLLQAKIQIYDISSLFIK